VGVKCSKAITRSEITRGFRVSENLQILKGGVFSEVFKICGAFSNASPCRSRG